MSPRLPDAVQNGCAIVALYFAPLPSRGGIKLGALLARGIQAQKNALAIPLAGLKVSFVYSEWPSLYVVVPAGVRFLHPSTAPEGRQPCDRYQQVPGFRADGCSGLWPGLRDPRCHHSCWVLLGL